MNQQESAEQLIEALKLSRQMLHKGVDKATILCLDLCPLMVGETADVLKVRLFRTRGENNNDLTKKCLFFDYEPIEGVDIKIRVFSRPISEIALLAAQYPN